MVNGVLYGLALSASGAAKKVSGGAPLTAAPIRAQDDHK
jgi:hypothetical protein